jgi:hypothetical protein
VLMLYKYHKMWYFCFMEIRPKYNFTVEKIRQANIYNTVYRDKLALNFGFVSAEIAARRAVLMSVVNSEENVRTSGSAFRDAETAIEWGVPYDVARMYDEAYADNAAFDASTSAE